MVGVILKKWDLYQPWVYVGVLKTLARIFFMPERNLDAADRVVEAKKQDHMSKTLNRTGTQSFIQKLSSLPCISQTVL